MPATAASRRARETAGHVEPAPPTREIILDTAERLFAARGVDGVAVRDLAREMGITASSLYNHFPSKQALYAAVLERGLKPIVELAAEAWQIGVSQPDDVGERLDRLFPHLARHPHIVQLLQRAMLEEDGATVNALLERWLGSLYRQGVGAVGAAAEGAGWTRDEVPHLAMLLYDMLFGYFAHAPALSGLAGWTRDPLSPAALAVHRRVLEEAIYRLLGPRPHPITRRRRSAPRKEH